jgi:uncharacterized protein
MRIPLRSVVCAIAAAVVAGATLAGLSAAEPCNPLKPAPVRDPQRIIQKRVESWQSLQRENVVMQQHDYSCGAAALATLIRYYWGDDVTELDFLKATIAVLTPEEIKDRVKNGLSMTDIRKAAVAKGYLATMGKRTLREMTELKVPVIVRIKKDDFEHFVVYRGMLNDRVFLADPIRGNIRLSLCCLAEQWTDGAVLVVAKPVDKLPENAPLLLHACGPVQPELQVARRALVLQQ